MAYGVCNAMLHWMMVYILDMGQQYIVSKQDSMCSLFYYVVCTLTSVVHKALLKEQSVFSVFADDSTYTVRCITTPHIII